MTITLIFGSPGSGKSILAAGLSCLAPRLSTFFVEPATSEELGAQLTAALNSSRWKVNSVSVLRLPQPGLTDFILDVNTNLDHARIFQTVVTQFPLADIQVVEVATSRPSDRAELRELAEELDQALC